MSNRPASTRLAIGGLLAAELVSSLGSQMTRLALPWFVLNETGSPARMTYVLAAGLLPVALLGIPSGTLVDRVGGRTTMVWADIASAPVVALVPLLHHYHALSFPLLLLLAAGLGALSTPYYASQRLVLPEVLGEDERAVTRANSLIEGTTETSNLAGPALAGVLIAVLGAANVLWLDAGSYAISALVLVAAVPRGARRPASETTQRSVFAGLRYLLHDRTLSRLAAASLVFGFAGPMLFGALPYLAFARYHHDSKIAGILIGCWGAGAVAGSALTFRLVGRLSPLQVGSIGVIGFVLPLWFLAFTLPPWGVGALLALSGLANPLTNAIVGVLTVRVPPPLRSKAMTSLLTINRLIGPAGYLIAGLVLQRVGIGSLFLLVAAIDTAAAFVFLSAAARSESRAPVPREAV